MGDEQAVWYSKGLHFQCTRCGDCCTGEEGYVWVSEDELFALAARLGEDREDFERRYVRRIGNRKSLKEFPNGDCVFFDNEARRCKVYSDRPRQCRTWPFWHENLRAPEAWNRACAVCPGSGQGRLYSREEIDELRQE